MAAFSDTAFFTDAFSVNAFDFGGTPTPTTDDPRGGKGDNRIYKPTGILHLPKKKGRSKVEDRVDESALIQAEVAEKIAREFGDETSRIARAFEAKEIVEMSMAEVDMEIGRLIRKKMRTDEDEVRLLLLVAVAAA